MKMDAQTTDPRRAALLTRYHSWLRLREQSNGEHQWQVARLLLAIWPAAPRHVLIEALFHDIGEMVTGDPPYPVKRDNPMLKEQYDRLESEARDVMVALWRVPRAEFLSAEEKKILKIADLLDMWEWALDELSLGNRHAGLVVTRIKNALPPLVAELPPEIMENVNRCILKRASHEIAIKKEGGKHE